MCFVRERIHLQGGMKEMTEIAFDPLFVGVFCLADFHLAVFPAFEVDPLF